VVGRPAGGRGSARLGVVRFGLDSRLGMARYRRARFGLVGHGFWSGTTGGAGQGQVEFGSDITEYG
jgi:hypothetical protein